MGIDYSEAMLKRAKLKIKSEVKGRKRYRLIQADLNEDVDLNNACVIIMNLILQFIRPLNRDRFIKNIYSGLVKNGCLILIEKIIGNNSLFNRTFIEFYYDFKRRNGYSELEIAKKREALENVLIPYRLDENLTLLQKSGFRHTDIFFKWYNFCGLLAIK
jgi:tRNA (cmo5U34)-methyltransferase